MAKQKMVKISVEDYARWVAMSRFLYMTIMAPLPTEGYKIAERLEKEWGEQIFKMVKKNKVKRIKNR